MSEGLPLIRRIRFTPWLDLLRLRLTGRLDWQSVLENSELPGEIRSIIHDVVIQSKLTSSEKFVVASELVAHFQDGYQAGCIWVQLINDFGDVQIIAELIQRSKERNRSMFAKVVKVLGMASLGTVVFAVIWAVLFARRQPTPNVDYLTPLNSFAVDAAEDQKAWLVYRESWIKHGFVDLNYAILTSGVSGDREFVSPDDASWPEAVAFLQDKQDLLDAHRRGGKLPVFGLELKSHPFRYGDLDQQALFPEFYATEGADWEAVPPEQLGEPDRILNESVIGILMPHTHTLRKAARMLLVDTRQATQQKDGKRVLENIEATFGAGRHAAEQPMAVCALVGFYATELGFWQIEEVLVRQPELLNDDDLVRLQKLVAEPNYREMIKLEGERAMYLDILQRTFTDDGNGDGRMTRDGLAMMLGLFPAMVGEAQREFDFGMMWDLLFASRKESVEVFDEFLSRVDADLSQPFFRQSMSSINHLNDLIDSDAPDHVFLENFVSGFDGLRGKLAQTTMQQQAVLVGIALEQFKRKTGGSPRDLAELVPDYLDQVPVDAISGQPFRYKTGDQPVVYCFGRDGVDNGGQPLVDENGRSRDFQHLFDESIWKGDVVLWPTPGHAW